MFETEEEKNKAQNNLNASIDRFNKAYDVMVDIGVLKMQKVRKTQIAFLLTHLAVF